jgi:hypothetical protein
MEPSASVPVPNQPGAGRWLGPLFAGLVFVAALWVMTRAWDASLLDRFQFRQTQTSLTAFWMQRDGFHLAYPTPIFGPPWSVPLEFPLYQWLVARLAGATGVSLVSAARLVGIGFFLSALPALYGLASLVERDPRRRVLLPAAVLTAPVCLFYSRAFMIESCAAALAVWFLYAHVRSLQLPAWRWTFAAMVFGVLSALVKVTTFALFGIPAALYTLHRIWAAIRRAPAEPAGPGIGRLFAASALPAALAMVATLWWIKFSDGIKGANPFSVMFMSQNLTAWNYGTMAQRLEPAFWLGVGRQLGLGAVSPWALVLLLAGLLPIASSYRRAALLCAAGVLIGPLLFSNLYAIHEYYYYPSAFFAAAAAGIVLAGILEAPRLGLPVKIAVLLAFAGLQAANFDREYATTLKHPPAPPPALVELVRQSTPEDGIVVVYGWDWNALIPYYAQRRAILIPRNWEEDADMLQTVLAKLGTERVAALVMQGPHWHDQGFIKWRTGRLNLAPFPVATSADGDLYIPSAAIAPLQAKLQGRYYPGVQLDFSDHLERPDSRLVSQKVDSVQFASVASPAPFALFTPWSIVVDRVAGLPAIIANAPSEIHFHAPAGTTRIEATVALNDASYAGPTPTDGVDVVIFELLPSGSRRVLYQRNLNPLAHPGDRGLQTISLEAIGAVSGPLVFAIYPGPADNITCDWSYWGHIKIR